MKYLFFFVLLGFIHCGNKGKKPLPPAAPPVKDTLVKQPNPLPVIQVEPDYDTTKWTEITRLDGTILLDLRYATANNFVEEKMYDCPRCFLRPEVARAVVEAHRTLRKQGLGLKMYDCYRPRPVQWKLWDKVPNPNYVADPRRGSMHNRGMAVDLTIVDTTGKELDMGTGYDFFGEAAYQGFRDLPNAVLENRQLLLTTMEARGFRPTRTEWWHYSYKGKTQQLDDWLWECGK